MSALAHLLTLQAESTSTGGGNDWVQMAVLFATACVLALIGWRVANRGAPQASGPSEGDAELLASIAARLEALERLIGERPSVDQAALSRALAELREAQAELGDRLEASLERLVGTLSAPGAVSPPAPASLSQRVTDGLLELGYERIQIVTAGEELNGIASGDGEVLVEVERQGVLHKGRVRVRGGAVGDVDVNPTYSIFP